MTLTEPKLRMHDITGQRRLEADLSLGFLTPRHTVGQALDHYLERTQIPHNGLRWNAFSRGVRLDNKRVLAELPDEDVQNEWTVMPEVSAG
jgi:hypothetical protein